MDDATSKKCRPLWHEARAEVKESKTDILGEFFARCTFEKKHAVVADYFRTLEIPKRVKSKRKKLRVFGHFCLSEQTEMDE